MGANAPRRDPRAWQIAILGTLLVVGVTRLGFQVDPSRIAVVLGAALLTQWRFTRALALPRFDPRSALITGLGICLLLRTGSDVVAAFAAVTAIASKFTFRVNGKHVFNPGLFGIVLAVYFTDQAWVSPGQWGQGAMGAFGIASLGLLVVHRSARSDVPVAFALAFAGLVLGRAVWLGNPLAIPLHQLSSGSLLLFTFFMISDPKTMPDARMARVGWAASVAALAFFIEFSLFWPSGPIQALFLLAPLVPVLDRWLPDERYTWRPVTVTAARRLNPSIAA